MIGVWLRWTVVEGEAPSEEYWAISGAFCKMKGLDGWRKIVLGLDL